MAAMECGICLLPVMLLSDEEHVILYATNSVFFYLKYQFCWATSFRLLHFFSVQSTGVFFMRKSFINIQESYIFLRKESYIELIQLS
jgi:hypothetical protein